MIILLPGPGFGIPIPIPVAHSPPLLLLLLLALVLCFFPAFRFCSLNARLRSKSSANHVNQDQLRDGSQYGNQDEGPLKMCRPATPPPLFAMYTFFFDELTGKCQRFTKRLSRALFVHFTAHETTNTRASFPNFPPLDLKTRSYLFFMSQPASSYSHWKKCKFSPK